MNLVLSEVVKLVIVMAKNTKVSLSLIFILIIFSGYLYMQNQLLHIQVEKLAGENIGLNKTYTDLLEKYDFLNKSYNNLQMQVVRLTEENIGLNRTYSDLLKSYDSLNASYYNLKSQSNLTRIIVLEDHSYLKTVKNLILHANKSVYVAIYVIKYDIKEPDDPVNQLLYVLVDAHNRGLDVKVLVDDPTLRSYPNTISYLKNNSVEVRLDKSKGVTSHMKIVIIDDKYLVVGSHNWTESALSYNHEYSVLISSQYFSEEAKNYFINLWKEGRQI